MKHQPTFQPHLALASTLGAFKTPRGTCIFAEIKFFLSGKDFK
jgi:hypothetical protein